jgi:pyrroline-5-carboxylate reductase
VLEGTPEARRRIRRLVADGRNTIIELEPGRKNEYLTAVEGCTAAFLPAVADAVDRFIRAGMKKAAAEKTATSLFEGSLRAYLRAGKRLLRLRPPASPPA